MIVEKNYNEMIQDMDRVLKKNTDGKYLITTYQMLQIKYLSMYGYECPFHKEAFGLEDYSLIDVGCGSSKRYGCIAMTMGFNCSDFDEDDNPALTDSTDSGIAEADFKEVGRRLLSLCVIDSNNDYTVEDALKDIEK